MDALSTAALFLFLALAVFAATAFALAWVVARLARQRAERAAAAGRARPWGGRDYQRVSSKYFEKERRARAARARQRAARAETGASFGVPPDPDRPPAPATADPETIHRATLGLGNAPLTPEAVRKAYVQRIQEYHPDRVATLGEKLRRLAEDETKRINEAYRFFRRRYGF